MDHRPNRPKSRKPVVFRDGFGRRARMLDSAATELEVLCLRPEFSTAAHEAALRERVSRLANLRGGSFARVRAVQRLNDSASTLALVSAATAGTRLSEILTTSDRLGVALDGSAGWAIVLQLTSAVALMHEYAPDAANGSIAPERIVITPDARVVVVEHVLGSLIEASTLSQEQAWKDQRVASIGSDAFDLRSDVAQVGIVALSLVLGRALRDDKYPARLSQLVESAMVTSVTGGREPMVAAPPLVARSRAAVRRAPLVCLGHRSQRRTASAARRDGFGGGPARARSVPVAPPDGDRTRSPGAGARAGRRRRTRRRADHDG